MDRNVSRHTFETFCSVDKTFYFGRRLVDLLEFRLFQRVVYRYIVIVRYCLGNDVNVGIRYTESAADVAYDRPCGERSEGYYLRHAIRAVASGDVIYNFASTLVAKVNVDIRHTYPFGIEETLKKQIEAYRIDLGDAKTIRDKTSRTRSSSWTYRNRVRLSVTDVVLNYQKIVGVAHFFDDRKFVFYAVFVNFFVAVFKGYLAFGNSLFKALGGQFF